MAYHKIEIEKGTLGEFSKIKEEFQELEDAVSQNHPVLEICELCDLIGAIEMYANKFNLSLKDLIKMKESNKNAFLSGKRT
jgi:NTP pyrophosphatase (non-canonical NTP hydrolase)